MRCFSVKKVVNWYTLCYIVFSVFTLFSLYLTFLYSVIIIISSTRNHYWDGLSAHEEICEPSADWEMVWGHLNSQIFFSIPRKGLIYSNKSVIFVTYFWSFHKKDQKYVIDTKVNTHNIWITNSVATCKNNNFKWIFNSFIKMNYLRLIEHSIGFSVPEIRRNRISRRNHAAIYTVGWTDGRTALTIDWIEDELVIREFETIAVAVPRSSSRWNLSIIGLYCI